MASSALIEAGALLPANGRRPEANGDLVHARRYQHPALGDRVVVRLVGETIAPAEDGALAFLGFAAPHEVDVVGLARKRGLGFPAWALVHAPEQARVALVMVKEFERASRMAVTKPGGAKDAFDELARELATTAPVLLPSFYEQAGRAFLAGANAKHAAMMFEKAREAERIYALVVDEAARRDVFLEFAFAGALTVRSLTAYATALAAEYPAPEAYEAFLELVLRRTLGGLPPWADTAKTLRRMAKAAKCDVEAEDNRLLEALLRTPASARATATFWRPYRDGLVRLSRRSAEIRGLLLNLFPAGDGSTEFAGWWLDVLDDAGALDALTLPADAPAGAAPLGGLAAWMSRLTTHLTVGGWQIKTPPRQFFSLITRTAQRLTHDGAPVDLSHRWRLDANVADAFLAAGVPISWSGTQHIDLWAWQRTAAEGVQRDLSHLAADQRFGPALHLAVPAYCGRQGAKVDDLLSAPGLVPIVGEWLASQVRSIDAGGLDQAAAAIAALDEASGPDTFSHFPELHAQIAEIQMAKPLLANLRGGLVDEFGWPALEQAVGQLDLEQLGWSTAWPALVVHDRRQAIVVGPEGVIASHDLRFPAGLSQWTKPIVRYSGGQFFVICGTDDGPRAYWSGSPDDVFPLTGGNWYDRGLETCAWLDDGIRVTGTRPLHPGDRSLPEEHELTSDGTTYWRGEWEQWAQPAPDRAWTRTRRLVEFDPATGQGGRQSLPAWFEDFSSTETDLELLGCQLLPAPAALANSPMGMRDGFVGTRVRRKPLDDGAGAGHEIEVESIDGMSARLVTRLGAGERTVRGLVRFPGDDAPRILEGNGHAVTLRDPSGETTLFHSMIGSPRSAARQLHSDRHVPAVATSMVLPPAFWHCLVPRDERGSAALRAVDQKAAAKLLDAAVDDLESGDDENAVPRTKRALGKQLRDIKEPNLALGVLGVVRFAATLERARRAFLAARTTASRPGGAVTTAIGGLDAIDDGAVLPGLCLRADYRWSYPPGGRAGHQMHAVAQYFAGELTPEMLMAGIPRTQLDWTNLIGRHRAAAYLAASPTLPEPVRQALLAYLELWATTPFATDPTQFRVGTCTDVEPQAITTPKGKAVVLPSPTDWARPGQKLTFAFIEQGSALPKAAAIVEDRRAGTDWTPDQIDQFLALARDAGPFPIQPEAVAELQSRTGLSLAEAALILGGLPNIDAYGSNFLEKPAREALGLKLADAKAARDTLRGLPAPLRAELFAAAAGDDPADLWRQLDEGSGDQVSPAARVAAVWVAAHGQRASLPEDAITAGQALDAPIDPAHWLMMLVDPDGAAALHRDALWTLAMNHYNQVELAASDQEAFSDAQTRTLALALPWAYLRPVGDPTRRHLAAVLDLVLARLSSPDLLIHARSENFPHREQGAELLTLFGKKPYAPRRGEWKPPDGDSRDNGASVAVLMQWQLMAFVRPSQLSDQSTTDSLRALTWFSGSIDPLAAIDALRSPGYRAMAERAHMTPVPDGGYEANPASSAADLVEQVAAARALTPDSAALYLQLLALHNPSDRNIQLWNGWTPARRKRAQAELVSQSLVLEAKRERAGRNGFVGGRWVETGRGDLPIEAWKLPFYGSSIGDNGRAVRPLGRLLPVAPLHELFATAWTRVEAGDRPEVTP